MSLFIKKPDADNFEINESVLLKLSQSYGTPSYFYDASRIASQYERLNASFRKQSIDLRVHYSVKASSSLGLLKYLRGLGAFFDVVSGGELERCLEIGASGNEIVFSGVGKSKSEIIKALENDILQFNVESESELILIEDCARNMKKCANIALRINPNIDALTHEYITTGTYDSKFGVSVDEAEFLYLRYKDNPNVKWVGLDMHIGSQLTEKAPIIQALKRFTAFAKSLEEHGLFLKNLDIGGGLGVNYNADKIISPEEFAALVANELATLNLDNRNIIMEPGRFLVAESGILMTEVLHVKRLNQKVYAIIDAGITELMRPSLYGAYHHIEVLNSQEKEFENVNVVGPICESSDYFAKNRSLPKLKQGDLLAVFNCGAYASSMSHTYNTRGRAPEVLVFDDKEIVLRRRELKEDLFALEI